MEVARGMHTRPTTTRPRASRQRLCSPTQRSGTRRFAERSSERWTVAFIGQPSRRRGSSGRDNSGAMPVRVLGFDGDDTLWHSETRFHVTQGEFRELLKRHVPDADIDTRLAEMEMKNLAIYG